LPMNQVYDHHHFLNMNESSDEWMFWDGIMPGAANVQGFSGSMQHNFQG
jgi:hypothetical protein